MSDTSLINDFSKLGCDINLGGSTKQYLLWGSKNTSEINFISAIKKALSFKAKTKPCKIARRFGCLIGLTYDQLGGNPYILDCIIKAFTELEKDFK